MAAVSEVRRLLKGDTLITTVETLLYFLDVAIGAPFMPPQPEDSGSGSL